MNKRQHGREIRLATRPFISGFKNIMELQIGVRSVGNKESVNI